MAPPTESLNTKPPTYGAHFGENVGRSKLEDERSLNTLRLYRHAKKNLQILSRTEKEEAFFCFSRQQTHRHTDRQSGKPTIIDHLALAERSGDLKKQVHNNDITGWWNLREWTSARYVKGGQCRRKKRVQVSLTETVLYYTDTLYTHGSYRPS